MGKIIELSKVSKSYGNKKVLENVSFDLEEGKFVTLIGCNGAGKSTTLRLLAGVEETNSGRIQILNQNPYSYNFSYRGDVFFIHEHIEMNYEMTLFEVVKIYRNVFPKWSNEIFNQIMKDRKLSMKKLYSDLSRGQKMQFLLIVGLSSRARILLLDEITAVIDIEAQRYFLDHLKKFALAGNTVIISTNILSELNDYTNHLLLIQDSKLMVNSPIRDLQKKFYVLKKTENHAIFSHPEAAKVRIDNDGMDLYLIPRKVLDEDTEVIKFKMDYQPKLEDILVLYFQLKEESEDQELLA
jgi:ABC-2 type transport system ATP-binding protein